MFISPAVAGNHVYIGSCSGTFFALDSGSGEVAWAYDTAQDGAAAQFHGDGLVTGELVVVGSDAWPVGHLYAFDRLTGEARWKHPFPGGVPLDILRSGDAALAVAMSGEVVAVNLVTGQLLWHRDDPPEGAQGTRPGDAALDDGRLFVPWPPGVVEAFDVVTGELLWRRDVGTVLNTGATVFNGNLVVGTLDGRLLRLRPADGEVLGSYETAGVPYGDLVDNEDCLVALWAEGGADESMRFAGPHAVACLEKELGGERWRYESPAEWGTFHPLVRHGQVILGSEGTLLALDLADGSVLWERPVRGLPRGLGTSQDALYVGTLEGVVFALPWNPETNP